MKRNRASWKWLGALVLVSSTQCAMMAPVRAVEPSEVNAQALQDLMASVAKTEEGDKLFFAKKWSEAAAVLKEANRLFARSSRRDPSGGRLTITVPPKAYPALRLYGYGMGNNLKIQEDATGKLFTEADSFNAVMVEMWQDAAILSGASEGPLGGPPISEPSIVEYSKDQLDSIIRQVYGPVSLYEMPVQNHQLQSLMLRSRRAQLLLTYALQKYPEWKSESLNWSRNNNKLQVTGDEALADVKAKLAEAEPEYNKLVGDFHKAEPKFFADTMQRDMEAINTALVAVKRDGWIDWGWVRDLYLSKDYLSERRKTYAKMYADEGKTLPAARFKPLETKIAALKAAIEQNAPRWSFPAGMSHNAAIESQVRNSVTSTFSGAVVLKTALGTNGWSIVTDEATGLPKYRQRSVIVLMKKPGQKWAWLIQDSYSQNYAGGGTYASMGSFGPPFYQARVQKGQ